MAHCPKCRYEYEESLKECPDCGSPLAEGPLPDPPRLEAREAEWEVLRVLTQRYEADLVLAVLESSGIPAYIKSEGANDSWYHLTVGPLAEVRVMVPKGLVDVAGEALKAAEQAGRNGAPSEEG